MGLPKTVIVPSSSSYLKQESHNIKIDTSFSRKIEKLFCQIFAAFFSELASTVITRVSRKMKVQNFEGRTTYKESIKYWKVIF